jgi:tRNA(Arg) A34 adenosine deaminase TadA
MEKAILYTSCAPCERCLGAIASLGVHNVVCGVSYKEFCKLLPFDYQAVDREGLLKKLGITMKLTESVKMKVCMFLSGGAANIVLLKN